MVVKFHSIDGEVFDTAEACMRYEEQLAKKRDVKCWNARGEELNSDSFFNVMICAIPENFYETDEDGLPTAPGGWVWFADNWVKCEKVIAMCQKAISYCDE